MINSDRKYEIVTCEYNGTKYSISSTTELDIRDIIAPIENAYEVVYALNKELDNVLDLKINESMYF